MWQPILRLVPVERMCSDADRANADDDEQLVLCVRTAVLELLSARQSQPLSLGYQHLQVSTV
jgi:hypothetical protein